LSLRQVSINMAAPVVSLTFFGLFLIAPVAIIMVLGVFKLIAWAGNAMLGRNHAVHSGRGGPGLWPVIAGAVPICLIVLALVLIKARTVHSVQVNSSDIPLSKPARPVMHVDQGQVTIVQDGTVVASEQISEVRQEILQAVQENGGQIPVDLPIPVADLSRKPAPEPALIPVESVAALASADEVAEASVVATPGSSTTEPTYEEAPATTVPAAVATEELPVGDNTAEQKPAADGAATTTPEVADAAMTPSPTPAIETPAIETPEQRQARLTELAAHISPWIRSLLNEAQQKETAVAADVAEAVESSDKQIVVFQLAGPIRQKYALIPLTPAFDAALSPVSPFLANGSLESIAESLAMFLKKPAKSSAEAPASAVGTETPAVAEPQPVPVSDLSAPTTAPTATPTTLAMTETTGPGKGNAELIPADELTEVLVGDDTPEWVDSPQPHQFVVRSDALFPGESTVAPLNKAINEVLAEQLRLYEESLEPALRAQARLVKLEIDEKTSQACVRKTFERLQAVGKDGSDKQDMRFVYALVELPESVKKAAEQTVRMSLQRDRVTGLAVIVFFAWLAICFASVVVRLWGRGGFFRKMIAIPILCLICIPLLLLAAGTGAATAGIPGSNMPRYPWADSSKPIRVQM
jgi:hypothetical protein